MKVTQEYLKTIRERCQNIVLATGTFDLFHYEHLRYLEDAKKIGDTLVVAVKDDKAARLKNPGRPIIVESQRIAIVDALKCVDYTILADYDENIELPIMCENQKQEQWLRAFVRIFEDLKPDMLYYEGNPVLKTVREKVFKRYNIRGVYRERTAIVSTSKIIAKINGSC